MATTTVPVRFSSLVQVRALDTSGTGAGPYIPAVVLSDEDGNLLGGLPQAVTYTTETNSTVTTGGTAQNALAANDARKALTFQNLSTGDMMLRFGGTASASAGFRVGPGQMYEAPAHAVPLGALSLYGATTGQAFYVAEG